MKAPVSHVLFRVLLWIALSGAPGGVRAWLWTPGTPATPHPAVARIFALDTRGASLGTGTLVAVSSYHGLVITNWHVVRDAKGAVLVQFADGFASPATVLKVDRDWDLAALAIWRPRAKPVPIAVDPPRPGEILMIAGYGQGDYRISYGPCTQYLSPSPNLPAELVELRATARQGDSGGPILNSRGELVGVLFGSGFRETMGAYCGRVRSFLMPLRDVFNNLPPPDPLLVQAANAGAPQVPSAGSSPGSYGNQAPGNASPTGSTNLAVPVQVPLVAGNQGPNPNGVSVASGDRMENPNGSPDYLASASTYQGISSGNINKVDHDLAIPSQGWRESPAGNSLASASSNRTGNMTNSGQATSYGTTYRDEPSYQGVYGTQQSNQVPGRSDVASDRSMNSSSDETKATMGSYAASYSNDRTKKTDSTTNTSSETSSYGSYSWGEDYEGTSSRDGIAGNSDPSKVGLDSNSGKMDSPELDRRTYDRFAVSTSSDSHQNDIAMQDRGSYSSRNNSTSNMRAERNDSASYARSSARDGITPPYSYGFDHSGTTDFASQDYSRQAEEGASPNHDYGTRASQKQRRNAQGYTASISTSSKDSRQPDAGSNSEKEDLDGSHSRTPLAQTIPPKKNQQSPSNNVSSGYAPIPIYDETEDEHNNDEGTMMDDEDTYSSSSYGYSGRYSGFGNSSSSTSSGLKESATRTSTDSKSQETANHDNRVNDCERAAGTSSWDYKGVQQNQRPQGRSGFQAKTAESNQRETRNAGSSFQANSSTNFGSDASEKEPSDSVSSDRWASDDGHRESLQSSAKQSSQGQVDSSSVGATSGTTTKQDTTEKATPGWETMIGVLGLLILFVQSMRWLSLLYDRSYYQRRRSYRPTRRRTTWSSAPPPAYRWYY